jgi:transcriptional regulator with XRE-family HTH domain
MACSVHERLRKARKLQKKTQEVIAGEIGVEQGTVSKWEAGRMPSRDLWSKIARAYGVSVRIFMPDDEGNGK